MHGAAHGPDGRTERIRTREISRAFIDGKTRFYRARPRRNGSPPPRVCVALVLFKRFTFVLRGVDGGRGGERGGRGR